MPTATPPKSSIYRTAERAVGNLLEFLTAERTAGQSFGAIASHLQDHDILITAETVRSWCQRLQIVPPSATGSGLASVDADGSLPATAGRGGDS